jgi:hypothetical protein
MNTPASGSAGLSETSMLNITILVVIEDILLLKQYLYSPSMWAAKVYFPLDSLEYIVND